MSEIFLAKLERLAKHYEAMAMPSNVMIALIVELHNEMQKEFDVVDERIKSLARTAPGYTDPRG